MNKKKQQENEMTENDLASYMEEKMGHLKPYWSHIGLAVCLVILAVIASVYVWEQGRANEAAKWRDLSIAQQNYRNTFNNESFKLLAEELPDERPGMWALLYAADAEVRSGLFDFLSDRESGLDKIQKAQTYYQKILDAKSEATSMLQRRATYGLAYAYESSGEFEKAAELYRQIVDAGDDNPFHSIAVRGMARSENVELAKLYTKFREFVPPADEDAPGMSLPQKPDISFPELGADQPNSGGGDFAEGNDGEVADSNDGNAETEESGS